MTAKAIDVIGAEVLADINLDIDGMQFRDSDIMRDDCYSAKIVINARADFFLMKRLAKEVAQIIEDMSEEDFDRLQEGKQ